MPVKNLVEDLLKNGIDLSHLSKNMNSSDSKFISMKKNNSLSVVI